MAHFRPPAAPPLSPDVLADLDRRGVPAVTAILANLPMVDFAILRPDQQSAYTLRVPDPYTTVSVMRSEVEAWLAWKGAVDGWWVRVGVWAAVGAAILALASCGLTVLAWRVRSSRSASTCPDSLGKLRAAEGRGTTMKLAGVAVALGALIISQGAQAAYCAGASHMGCYPGIDGSGRPPMAMYEAAVEGLKEARNPAEAKLAIQAMYDAFNPRAADWRAIYCNGHASGPGLYQSCIQSMH